MNNDLALNPASSIVVEACAGSGKTWLLVSRIVRLLLDGAQPAQILAITFTRKAAQEMQSRLQLWLRDLATRDDEYVQRFFSERGLKTLSDAQLQQARRLYSTVLLAQPGIAISTFHGWFMQVMQRAPLNSDVMQGMALLEKSASVQQEAWDEMLEQMHRHPDSAVALEMQWLFSEYGLHTTQNLLFNFLAKRAEWWAYTRAQADPLNFALGNLQADLAVDLASEPMLAWNNSAETNAALFAFTLQLASKGTEVQNRNASELERAWTDSAAEQRYQNLWLLLFTQAGEPRKFKPTKSQNAEAFFEALHRVQTGMQAVQDELIEQQAYRLNQAVLHCGSVFLQRYQDLKLQQQKMDFADLEWQLCHLLKQSEHAETMQYKLDSRYRHVLLDEFQDTNPLQWQILRAWFDAAVAVDSQPTVFVVGDPKQSIYRFRRADARLFSVAREYLQQHFAAHALHNNHTRRNAPEILEAVNSVFAKHPEGFVDFEIHTSEHKDLPGYVAVLPLCVAEKSSEVVAEEKLFLRNPLTTQRAQAEAGGRQKEAEEFAGLINMIVRDWQVNEDGMSRRACYGDIMVLVRKRTHLAVYEEALRGQSIPFLSSRRGGLLDALEASDLQALLLFLITPFADLALAQVLRTPIFACSDADLMLLAQTSPHKKAEGSWWQRLESLADSSPALSRAHELLHNWLALADKLPVHDLLDRIYFEGDVIARYTAVLPLEMRAKVTANLHEFMKIALDMDSGRYPSLPRFLQELRELRDSSDDAPNEGRLGVAGNAVRILTVHESKGLEAPIVWLLDANNEGTQKDGNDVLLDWPTHEEQPLHFSVYTDLASRGKQRAPLFAEDAAQQARENMNLLYVAMTRARQALIVSGHCNDEAKEQSKKSLSWYDRIAAEVVEKPNLLLQKKDGEDGINGAHSPDKTTQAIIPGIIATGKRRAQNTPQQQRGIWLHALLQYLTNNPDEGLTALPNQLGILEAEDDSLRAQAKNILNKQELVGFFNPREYVSAGNELPYINAQGELKRIDRLVEFENEVWVLDYKLGDSEDAARYARQMQEYRAAMQSIYAGKTVRCALIFADGELREV